MLGFCSFWFFLFLDRLDRGSIVDDPLVHLWGLSILAYILLPRQIQFPQYKFPLAFMQLRVSFFIAVLFCAVVAGGLHGRSLTRASCLLAGAFFSMRYLDAKSLNQVEAELTRMVSALPPGQRLVSALWDTSSLQINGLLHVGSGAYRWTMLRLWQLRTGHRSVSHSGNRTQ